MAERWRLVVRDGPSVRKSSFTELDAALDAMQAETAAAAARPPAKPVEMKVRVFEPSDQVVLRAVLKGPERFVPKIRCGLDVRGDGRLEAWLGGNARIAVEPGRRETVWHALRRELGLS
jgi:hypothetical protein